MKAPLKLSSEMRLLLAALVLVALVGGWYTWNNRTTDAQSIGAQSASPSVTAPVTPAATTSPTPGTGSGTPGNGASRPARARTTPSAAGAGKPAKPAASIPAVTPARPTTVLTIPPLSSAVSSAGSQPGSKPAASGAGVTETDAEVQRPPAGINPNTPLAAVPVVNPFSPLKVVADPNSSPAPVPATAQVPQQQIRSAPSVAATPPVRTAGVIPSTPIPVAEVSAAPNGPRLGGILPAPAINTGAQAALDAKAAAAEQQRALAEQAKAQAIAQADAKRTEAAQAKALSEQQAAQAKLDAAAKAQIAAAKAQADKVAKAQAIAAARAKLLAAQQARRAADIAAAAANARAKASASAPATAAMSTTPPASSSTSPAPSTAPVTVTPEGNAAVGTVQPGVITQLGSNAPGTPATAVPAPTTPLSTLDRYIQERSLSVDSVVLGPLNTAIFKTDRGLVVVSVGQNIPDTTIVVREVTANSATLALDTNTKILQLEKR